MAAISDTLGRFKGRDGCQDRHPVRPDALDVRPKGNNDGCHAGQPHL